MQTSSGAHHRNAHRSHDRLKDVAEADDRHLRDDPARWHAPAASAARAPVPSLRHAATAATALMPSSAVPETALGSRQS
jgi:hypothetical protein